MQHPPPTPHLPNDRKKHVMYATLIHSPPKIKCYFYFYYLIYTGSAISHPIQFFDYLAQQSQLKVFFLSYSLCSITKESHEPIKTNGKWKMLHKASVNVIRDSEH